MPKVTLAGVVNGDQPRDLSEEQLPVCHVLSRLLMAIYGLDLQCSGRGWILMAPAIQIAVLRILILSIKGATASEVATL